MIDTRTVSTNLGLNKFVIFVKQSMNLFSQGNYECCQLLKMEEIDGISISLPKI